MPTARTITGLLALAMIALPLLVAPFRLEQSARFIRVIENRSPSNFPRFHGLGDLIDAQWWSGMSKGFEDRVPFRAQAVGLRSSARAVFNRDTPHEDVAPGRGEWLYFRRALDGTFVDDQTTANALATIDRFFVESTITAEVYLLAAPDKATIYPEHLTAASQREFAPTIPQRQQLRDWFRRPGTSPNRLDVWTPMLACKSASDEPIYDPAGSHYNGHGAMVLARQIIDAIDPTLWDDSEQLDEHRHEVVPEMARMAGYLNRRETYIRTHRQRPGVRCVALTDENTPVDNPAFLTIGRLPGHHPKHIVMRSDTRRLIPGRTLIVHDSFIAAYLEPTLSQFFEDIQFIHFATLTPETLRDAMTTYDRVIYESTERLFVARAFKFFSKPAR